MADPTLSTLTKMLHQLLAQESVPNVVAAAAAGLRARVKQSGLHVSVFRVVGVELTADERMRELERITTAPASDETKIWRDRYREAIAATRAADKIAASYAQRATALAAQVAALTAQVAALTAQVESAKESANPHETQSVYRQCMRRFAALGIGDSFTVPAADRSGLERARAAYMLRHPGWLGTSFRHGDAVTFRRSD